MIIKSEFYKKMLFWIETIFEVIKLTVRRLKEAEEKANDN